MHHGGADAAPDAERAARGNQLRGMAERPGDVGDGLARFQRHQVPGALAYGLDDQGDGAGAGVRVGDGQGNALGALGPVHNDELAGLPDLGDARRDDVQPGDIGAELGFGKDVMHAGLSLSLGGGMWLRTGPEVKSHVGEGDSGRHGPRSAGCGRGGGGLLA